MNLERPRVREMGITLEAAEEAVINSLFRAKTVVGRDGHVSHALPLERVVEIMRRYGRSEVHLP